MAHTTSAAMIRTVALLALISSASASWFFDSEPTLWISGLAQGFPKSVGLPRNLTYATNQGWELVEGPATSSGYDELLLYVNASERTTGLYFDGDNVAGLLIAIPADQVTPYYNTTNQGLESWTSTIKGETKTYLTSSIFFVSEDKSTRTYDTKEVIQTNKLAFVSIDGKIDTIPKNLTDIKNNASSIWTKQRCLPLMGLHYYYNMTTSTSCDEPFVPYFGLYDNKTNQLIGVGFMSLGKCTGCSTFEDPNDFAVKMIVNNGPECLYEMAKEYGVTTRHIYFVDNPANILWCH